MDKKKGIIICSACHKGGVGKSQLTLEKAAWLAKHNQRVLLVDTDPQANITDRLCGANFISSRFLPDIILDGDGIQPEDILSRTILGITIDYVPSNAYLTRIETRLKIVGPPKEYLLKHAIAGIRYEYDYILIDTPPMGELLTLAGMIASDLVVIPTLPDKPSIEGVDVTVRTIREIAANEFLNPKIGIAGIVVGRFHNTTANRYFLNELKEKYGDLVKTPVIRECTKVQQAIKADMPTLLFAPGCPAAKDYDDVFSDMFNSI